MPIPVSLAVLLCACGPEPEIEEANRQIQQLKDENESLLAELAALKAKKTEVPMPVGCESVASIEGTIECLQVKVKEADAAMARYLDASKKRHAADTDPSETSVRSIEALQDLWLKFSRDSHCNTIGLYPRDEAKTAAKYLYCRFRVTRERTHELWEKYLRHPDGTSPELPEPEL